MKNKLLILIIIIGTLLRCYHYFNIPMTHDELSALARLNFSSFQDLIENGVKPDGHPAGIQVFLYYWTSIFGKADAIVKLPFIFMGIASIFVSYLISRKWFNETSAILISASIASLQFPIMYSQICRPYISGMFFCLLTVYCWTHFIFGDKKLKNYFLIAFIFTSAFCTYNHHFSLLFTFIIYITGLFFLKKDDVSRYLLAGISILLLYVPHLEIFFAQLNLGGLDWLGVPRNSFILDHIKFIFHFSPLVYITTSLLFISGIYFFLKNKTKINSFQIISLIWFFSSLLIGFFYSKYYKPVLQHSVLIFTFPYLLFFIFSWVRTNNVFYKYIMVFVILSVNIYSLIYDRKHYEIFYNQPFNKFSELTHDFLNKHNSTDATILLNENPIYLDHYFTAQNPTLKYIATADIALDSLRKIVSGSNSKYLICGNVPSEYTLALREYYPYLIFKDYGFTYEYYVFSKDSSNLLINDVLYTHSIIKTENNNSIYSMDSTMEWGPSFEVPLNAISQSRHNFIDVSIEYLGKEIELGRIAFELRTKDSLLLWRGIDVQGYSSSLKKGGWQKAYFTLRSTVYFKNIEEMNDCKLLVFYWNYKKKNVLLRNFTLQIRKGNEKVYALVEDFKE